MIRAVFDTNLLASGFVGSNPEAPPAQLIDAWRRGAFTLVTSEHIIAELIRTFQSPYFRARITPDQVRRIERLLRRRAIVTAITAQVSGVATHPEDDWVLATAISARADYLVTGDGPLQRLGTLQNTTIVSPREFLRILSEQ